MQFCSGHKERSLDRALKTFIKSFPLTTLKYVCITWGKHFVGSTEKVLKGNSLDLDRGAHTVTRLPLV